MWQNIFGFLDLPDLLRSLRVCTEWRDKVRSTEPTLRDKMFKDRVVPPQDEGGSGEKANDKSENMGDDKGADDHDDDKRPVKGDSDDHLSNATDNTKSSVPAVTVNLRAAADLLCVPGSFPQAVIKFEVEFNTEFIDALLPDDFPLLSNFPSGTTFHPILLDLEGRLPLVDNLFRSTDGEPYRHFSFGSFEDLNGLLERRQRRSHRNDGSWKDMLLCVPAQQRIDVIFDFTYYSGSRRNYTLLGESGCGVTMGQFVRAFRDQLKHIEEDVRGFPQEMLAYCSECWEKNHEL
ncbi:hypothetical protein J4E91_006363 [Alternaria rosae]|nr:hypothetical protein J4E91_006363 [Alternaria rosae]